MFSFSYLINNSLTIGLGFLFVRISVTISSNRINILVSLSGFYSSIFSKISFILFEYSIKALESLY